MTERDKRELAARLVMHANHVERIGIYHPAYRYPAMVKDLREAAEELRRALAEPAADKEGNDGYR